jgi:hypothetical protein
MGTNDEVDRLYDILNQDEIQRAFWQSGLDEFSIESKNELIKRIAETFDPPPRGALLARLLFIVNDQTQPALTLAYLTNLRSPDPEARTVSLYGLQKLGHPNLTDIALAALRDDADQVVMAAITVLMPKAQQDPAIRKILEEVYATHKDKPEFHMSMSTLKGQLGP